MKGILAVVAVLPFVLCSCTIRVEAQNCGPIPFNPCALDWQCTSDSGWVVTKAELPGTPCPTVKFGPSDGTCQGSATTKFGSTAMCVPSSPPPPSHPLYKIGGRVSGLSPGNTVTLQDNGPTLTLTASNGPFEFSTDVAGYNVTVALQPAGQHCNVSNGHATASGTGVSNITVACATPPNIACDATGKNCVSEADICANVSNPLMNPPKVNGVTPAPAIGFVCIAGGLPPVYGGLGREATDPPLTPMSPDLVTNIASVSKTITAIAILQLLQKNGLTIHQKISPYLYPDWHQGQGPYVDKITFRELLTHTSGFGQTPNCGTADAYSDIEALVAGGVTPTDIGHPKYGNCNFALLRELMPALIQNPSPIASLPDGPTRAAQSSAAYISYVNANVFQPVGVPASTCAPPVGSNGVLSYSSPTKETPGNNWGDWSLTCGAGGWNLSANQIFSVINDLANGNALLTNAWKSQMFANCLGWDCVPGLRDDCPSPNVCKNGYLGASCESVAIWTYAGIFTTVTPVIPVVVVVNSPTPPPFAGWHVASNTPEAPDIIDLVECAYSKAFISGTSGVAHPCP